MICGTAEHRLVQHLKTICLHLKKTSWSDISKCGLLKYSTNTSMDSWCTCMIHRCFWTITQFHSLLSSSRGVEFVVQICDWQWHIFNRCLRVCQVLNELVKQLVHQSKRHCIFIPVCVLWFIRTVSQVIYATNLLPVCCYLLWKSTITYFDIYFSLSLN